MTTTPTHHAVGSGWLAICLVACLITCLAGGCASAPDGPRVVDPGFSYLRHAEHQAQSDASDQGRPGQPSDQDPAPGHQARHAKPDKPVI